MINQCMFIGRLSVDPEVRAIPDGTAVANFTLACNEKFKTKNGENKEKTEWIKVVAWGKLAEICGEYLRKGSLVYIEGKLQTRSWEDRDGNKKYTTEIVAREMKMLGGKERAQDAPEHSDDTDFGDDIPF